MEIATLVLAIIAALVTAVSEALGKGDWSVLDKPVRDVLPSPLRITVERHRAELAAAAKFGEAPASKPSAPPANPYIVIDAPTNTAALPLIRPVATHVIGCKDCGKPMALVGDPIPADGLCQWCTDEVRPARS